MNFQAPVPADATATELTPAVTRPWRDLVTSLRPRQWLKNGLVFMALLFSINEYWSLTDLPAVTEIVARSFAAFVLFSMLSSAAYLLNDVMDASQDRAHPTKRNRPIAAGRVSPTVALAASGVLAAGGLGASLLLGPAFALVTAGYIALTTAYTLGLKHQVILDICILSMGFVLRAVGGAVAIQVPISPWLYVCTFLGALFLAIPKRRHELLLLQDKASEHRKTLEAYSPELLDQMLGVVAPSTVIAYCLYTFSAAALPMNHAMMWTLPFVVYGVFRYLFLVYHKQMGGSPEETLLGDKPLLLDVLLWLVASGTILVVFRGQE